MKRFLLWLVGVVLGVGVFLGAVMGVSYAFTTEGSCPDSAAQFGTEALESNGACWQVPLIGGQLDKVFASPATLTVQKLGILYTAHPALTLPDWSVYTTLTIRTASGETVFTGTASEYESFLFPANGEYKAELTVWRVPEGGTVMQFEGGSTGAVRRNLRLEKPAKPTGWYRYSFRFTLQAGAEVELSAERVEQGGIVGLRISGMTGDAAPTVETDLGNVQCVRAADGWRAYIPAAYNASSGGHEVNITVNGETVSPQRRCAAQGFWHGGCGAGAGCIGSGEHPVPQCGLGPVRSTCAGKALAGRLCEPGGKLHHAGGLRSGQGGQRPAGQPLQLHKALHHSRRALPRPGKRRGGAGRRAGPHRQHGGHRPRLRDAQLPVRAADSFRLRRADAWKRGRPWACWVRS